MLNRQQMAAVKYISGPLLVLAGAGSGKTRVITQKIHYLIETCDYSANSIYAVTFTNKAANEMRARVASLIPANKRRGLKVSTFHTLGLSIIKRDVTLCGLKKGFSILDTEDSRQIIAGLFSTSRGTDKEFLHGLQQQISRWKNDLLSPEQVACMELNDQYAVEAAILYPRYEQTLKAYNAVDFDDLILLPVQLFTHQPDVLEYWQNKIRHLLVDEYQDSNASQYILVKKLVGVRAHFTVVGDDHQSIYAFRGAKPENLIQLQHDYPQLKVIKLEQNYRSTTRILQAANQLITNNPYLFDKKLWSELGHGELLRVIRCKDEQDEAEQVVADLLSHIVRHGTSHGDYAILYRGNHQSRIFEKALRHYGVPYRVSGGQSWFAKSEVKDIFAYLKLLCNDADDAAFLRVINTPKRGIGEASLQALGRYTQAKGVSLFHGADHLALSEHVMEKPRLALMEFKHWLMEVKTKLATHQSIEPLKQMVEDSGYEAYLYEQSETPAKAQKRMENVWELIDWVGRLLAKDPDSTLADIVNKLILIDILEQADEQEATSVQLMTLHASKGLEFPYVYLVGMEEELLPHRESIEGELIEEERRLAYVGITRAQKELCFTLARQRRKAGEVVECQPSRFLDELPQDSLEWFGKSHDRSEEKSKQVAKSHLMGLKELLGQSPSSMK
jgi:ATP-dependent DNA helicase Rep